MNLKAIRKSINDIKETIGESDKPSIQGFFKWCERHYYHREVHCGELWFPSYKVSCADGTMREVKSDTRLFLLCSEKYFTEIHNVKNPIKDGQHGLKGFLSIDWFDKYKPDFHYINKMIYDPDYCQWFETKWEEFIETEDLSVFTEICKDC